MGKLALVFTFLDCIISLSFYKFNTDNPQVDWTSYVAQGEAVYDGVMDYEKIIGPMGPIAYFAGHAYFYAFLSWTKISSSFRASQLLFTWIHIFQTYILVSIVESTFKRRKLQILCAVLYLMQFRERFYWISWVQNDCIMILFMEIAVLMVLKNQTFFGIFFFNCALSFKVGVVFWLPGFLLILAKKRSILCPIFLVLFTIVFQIAIAQPFIKVNKDAYLRQTFGTDRRLPKRYSLLYNFIPDEIFYTKEFALGAISTILSLNVLFLICKWTNWRRFFADIRVWPLSLRLQNVDGVDAARIIFTSVLIQTIFNYQMHSQFFLWSSPIYPFLVTVCKLPVELKLIMSAVFEYGTIFSSYPQLRLGASILHVVLLIMMWFNWIEDSEKPIEVKSNEAKLKQN